MRDAADNELAYDDQVMFTVESTVPWLAWGTIKCLYEDSQAIVLLDRNGRKIWRNPNAVVKPNTSQEHRCGVDYDPYCDGCRTAYGDAGMPF